MKVDVNLGSWLRFAVAVLCLEGCGSSGGVNHAQGGANMTGSSGSSGAPSASGGSSAGTSAGTGDAGRGGMSGTSGAAGAASAGETGAHCQPGKTIQTYPYDVDNPCYGDNFAYHLPNAENIQLEDFRLDTPTTAGERFAFSVRHVGIGPFEIEIWGTHEQCGVAKELLWRGPMITGIQCGEFVPSDSYSHLLYVYRKQTDDSYSFSMPELTLCTAGSCPAGVQGQGREPQVAVTPAPLIYEKPHVGQDFKSFDLGLDIYGHAILMLEGAKQPKGTPNKLKQGVLRMGPDDPFGDAWYCVGKDSTVVEVDNDPGAFEYVTYTVSLKNLTRLPNCGTMHGTGTASFVITQGSDATITSSFSDLTNAMPYAEDQSCSGTNCSFLVSDSQSGDPKRWLFVTPVKSVGDYFMPTAVPTGIADAILFNRPDPTLPLEISCSQAGTLSYNPADTTTLSLESMSDYFACPGEPVDDDQLEFSTL
ncbi:MAG: hypothetical protein WDO69_34960 [Pseudomonadota bacterium]